MGTSNEESLTFINATFSWYRNAEDACNNIKMILDNEKSITFDRIIMIVFNCCGCFERWFKDIDRDLIFFDMDGFELHTDEKTSSEIKIPIPKTSIKSKNIQDSGERMSYGEGMAEREPSDGKGRFDLITPFGLMRIAKWYELRAKKYKDRNWEKGMPFSRYVNSAFRHLVKYMIGMNDEDHLAAVAWNVMAIMHHEELGQKELDDMPHYFLGASQEIKDDMNKNRIVEE